MKRLSAVSACLLIVMGLWAQNYLNVHKSDGTVVTFRSDQIDFIDFNRFDYQIACPVTLSDFRVINSQYCEGAFVSNGQTYDYRFCVSVTATLDDKRGNIDDWGYARFSKSGCDTLVSLKLYGQAYTDTCFVCFSNESCSTCTFRGFVKYADIDNYVYSNPYEYPLEYGLTACPDSNHPHMIAMGLPSGTKWACCNVGADVPEESGDFYAWGETETKNYYSPHTYQFAVEDSDGAWYEEGTGKRYTYTNIGTDITGSSHDAATANWGYPWRMPTQKQYQELINNCKSEWTKQNGVYGRLFTGLNGGTIFIPASGYRSGREHSDASTSGYYWTSELYKNYQYCAYSLFFSRVHVYYDNWYDRDFGLPIRPVRKN